MIYLWLSYSFSSLAQQSSLIAQGVVASPESKSAFLSFPTLFSKRKMDHLSRSTLPSDYIHLLDNNRSIDVSTIKGNISDGLKRLGQAAWDFFVSTDDKSFGANIWNLFLCQIDKNEPKMGLKMSRKWAKNGYREQPYCPDAKGEMWLFEPP